MARIDYNKIYGKLKKFTVKLEFDDLKKLNQVLLDNGAHDMEKPVKTLAEAVTDTMAEYTREGFEQTIEDSEKLLNIAKAFFVIGLGVTVGGIIAVLRKKAE